MKINRHKTKVIKIGNRYIGGDYPVAIQSMAKTKTADSEGTIKQIKELEAAGCEIVRVAIKDDIDAHSIGKIKKGIKIPLVADIHFNWRLALAAIEQGADKVRLNPGNIYKKDEIREVAQAAKMHRIPIRIGVNSGSIRKLQTPNSKLQTHADQLVKSALDYIKVMEKNKFHNIVISLKASNVLDTIEAYRKISRFCDYPLHLGVTATGLPFSGAIKSGIAIGGLLLEGLGDTIRVSLTDEPAREISAARAILEGLELRRFGPEIISCPTCGRCEVDLVKVVREIEARLLTPNFQLSTRPLKVAVMGCVVNGPGEAKDADIGVAFGKKVGLFFKAGKPVKKVAYEKCADLLIKEILES